MKNTELIQLLNNAIEKQEAKEKALEQPSTQRTLQDLTGQESGVVIYDDEAIICNWASIDGFPRVGPFGLLMGLGEEIPDPDTVDTEELTGKQVAEELSGIKIIYEDNEDEGELREGKFAATVYRLPGMTIIAPEDWA